MAGKKFSILKSSNNDVIEETTITEKKDNYPIIDTEVIEFISKEFPNTSKEISNSLTNLKNTLEKTIDYIEDISSSIIKNERNFSLSGKYRDTSIRLHDISISIEKYIQWMKGLNNKATLDSTPDNKDENEDSLPLDDDINDNFLEICNDFTDKNPLYFKLDSSKVKVDDWNDLVIKTADILIKNYKNSKDLLYSNITFPNLNTKKSPQNDFRDTIIEMLLEYKIDLSRYFISIN
ncbi:MULTISPECIES: hypothetical protein [unclassified Clostridium]|nr:MULTISPECIES: hypothetical protein [unclassified Clostridium]MCR1950146.1 hypothetical protein [Clostridium sp. DSM 100503]